MGVVGDTTGCLGCVFCQKRLKLSWTADECKPLPLTPHSPRVEGCAMGGTVIAAGMCAPATRKGR